MNLYQIMLEHHAPKDSQLGILTYLVAESNEQVYDWLSGDIELKDNRYYYTSYTGREEDEEGYKEKIVELQGSMYDEDEDYCDLYYGKTVEGWELVKEGIAEAEIAVLQSCGISIEIA